MRTFPQLVALPGGMVAPLGSRLTLEEECPLTSSFLSASRLQFGCDLSGSCSFHMLPCYGGLYPSEIINQNKLLDLQVAFDCGMLPQQERSD